MRGLNDSEVVQGHYLFYTGMIYHELLERCKAGDRLSQWVAMQKKAGKDLKAWYPNLLMGYYDTCLSDKQAAYGHALAILSSTTDKSNWHYQRA